MENLFYQPWLSGVIVGGLVGFAAHYFCMSAQKQRPAPDTRLHVAYCKPLIGLDLGRVAQVIVSDSGIILGHTGLDFPTSDIKEPIFNEVCGHIKPTTQEGHTLLRSWQHRRPYQKE